MTQDTTSNSPPDDFESQGLLAGPQEGTQHDLLPGDDSGEIEALLRDAYDSPPLPPSLSKRIDQGISQQWGVSPQLVRRSTPTVHLASLATRHASRVWPYVVGLAAALLLAVFLTGGSGNYAWAAVVDAIKRHGVLEIVDGDSQRWLDLSEQVAGERRRSRVCWVDLREQSVFSYEPGSDSPRRSEIVGAAEIGTDTLLAAVLLDQPLSAESLQRLQGLELIDQKWSRQEREGRDVVQLQVRLRTREDDVIRLSLDLDPESKLPRTVQVSGETPPGADPEGTGVALVSASSKSLALEYSNASAAELRAGLLDGRFPVAGGSTSASGSTPRIASSEKKVDGSTDDVAPPPASDVPFAETRKSGSPHPFGSAEEAQNAFAAALPIGAANTWKPVVVVPRTDREVVERIDAITRELWEQNELEPVARASDVQLLRRAFLDLAGRTPTVGEVRDYLSDDRDERYERLIDRLLDSPDHASQMAAVWRAYLIPEGVDLDAFGGREAFEKWLSERFGAGESYDATVRKLLLADGRLSQSGPLLFYSALKLDADQLAAKTSRVFLGMRLECAQCHDHPFEPWTQNDFWSFAAFFARISRPQGELESASTVMRVHDIDRGEVMLPETEQIVPPRFLGEAVGSISAEADQPQAARRQQLARWLTGPENPYFARATVNRLWGHLFGRGIVDPIDDFGELNPPVSPELLDTLAAQFIDSEFDMRRLLRSMALSNAYRLSSSSNDGTESEDASQARIELFAQMNVKTLTAEQLYDCISVATLMSPRGRADTSYSVARFGNSDREQFLQQFASPTISRSEYLAGIPQALTLMNGSLISGATGESSSGLIQSLSAPFFTDRQRIDVLFMSTLSRPARDDELESLGEFLPQGQSAEERAASLADLLWALLNSSEFTLNH